MTKRLFTMLAALCASFAFFSCLNINEPLEGASVSFSLSPEAVRAIADAVNPPPPRFPQRARVPPLAQRAKASPR